MRVIDFFDKSVGYYPDRVFVQQDSVKRTYLESQRVTHRIANALHRDGFDAGVRIAVYAPNDYRIVEVMYGLFRAGAVLIPVNIRNPIKENLYVLNMVKCNMVFYHSAFEAHVSRMKKECPSIRQFVCIDTDQGEGAYLADWMDPSDKPAPYIEHKPTDLFGIFATSGTTGNPKGVLHTHQSLMLVVIDFLYSLGYRDPQIHYCVAPVTHLAGTFIFSFSAVGSTTILESNVDPLKIMKTIEEQKVTVLFLPPTVIYMMLAHPQVRDFDYSSLKNFIYAAAPMSPEKVREANEVFGPVMTNIFGQTESPAPTTILLPEEHRPDDGPVWEKRLSSIGRACLSRWTEIMDENGNILPPHETGELVVRGSGNMAGYLDDPEATAEACRFGWHHTGDMGFKDEEGYITLVDRKKDMIVSGGFNVFSVEVEKALLSHEAVLEAAVIGVPDEKWGEAVKGLVELKPDQNVSEEELIAYCKERIGSVKAPKGIDFISELPRSATGKVLKRKLRDKYWEGRERKI